MKRLMSDLSRVFWPLVLGTMMVFLLVPIAQMSGEPALAPWGLFGGLAFYGVALSHVLRRLFFPYIDMKALFQIAKNSATGAGIVFLGVCIVLATFLLLMGNLVHAGELPPNAIKYLPTLKAEQATYWPGMPAPSMLAAQVEQETCTSLKSARCWSPRAELRTSRERGVGLGQITKTSRFDALSELQASHPHALAGWSWDSVSLYDPVYQLRALVLKDLQNWKSVQGAATDTDRLAFTFAGYNGGVGGVISDRRMCKGTAGCDHGRWFGHVERTSLKSKVAVSGYGKSFFEINREYVVNIMHVRRKKYDGMM